MADRVNMSLEDIIKENKKAKGGGGAGRKFDMKRKISRGRADGSRKGRARGVLRGKNRGGVSKSTNCTRDYVTGTRLLISNLHIGVSDSDIQELFSELGILKSAAVHYDRSGRSLGTADVVFKKRGDALKAIKQYNGVPLDGLAMNIQLITSENNTVTNKGGERGVIGGGLVKRNLNRGNVKNRIQRGGGGVRGDARRGRGGAARSKRPVPTAEQLDAELDEYVKECLKIKIK